MNAIGIVRRSTGPRDPAPILISVLAVALLRLVRAHHEPRDERVVAAGKRGSGKCIGDSGGEIGRSEASAEELLRRWLGELDRTPLHAYRVRRRGEVPFVNGDAKRRVMMFTAAPYQHLDAGEMYKHHGSDADLVAVAHVERVDAGEVRERRVGDADLVAVPHVKRVDAGNVRERSVGDADLVAVPHV